MTTRELPAPAPVRESSATSDAPPPLSTRLAVSLMVVILGLGGLLWWLFREPEARPETIDSTEVARIWSARQALAEGDPLEARVLAKSCVGPRGPCAGADSLLKEIDAALKLSPCGSDEKAKAFIAEAKRADPEVVGQRMRECVAGRRLHPLAGRAIQELELVKPEPEPKEEAPQTE